MPSRGSSVALLKAIKDKRQEVRAYAFSGVSHSNLRSRFNAIQFYLYKPSLGSELDRIGEEVPDDLLHPGGICLDMIRSRIQQELQLNVFPLRGRTNRIYGGPDYRNEFDRFYIQSEFAGDTSRNVENVLDKLCL